MSEREDLSVAIAIPDARLSSLSLTRLREVLRRESVTEELLLKITGSCHQTLLFAALLSPSPAASSFSLSLS